MIKLDAQQQAIVDCNDKNIIVAAGAGSGKTRVLTERIKRLLNDGVPPMNIVSITFTNMAADEMKERLSDVPGISDAFIGTIHSFANRIYGNSGQYYEIFCWEKECELMKQLIRRYAKYCNFDEYMRFCDLNKLVELGRMDGEDVKDQFAPSVLKEIHQLLNGKTDNDYPENVRTLCKAYNIITFDDLLKYATDYYSSIGATIEYLLVDELQDIGPAEYKFLMALNANNNFCVGDDYQAIYGFKGGDVSIFKRLMKDNSWTTFYLENNYRSCKEITDLGNKVISQVPDRIDKKTVNIRKDTGKVVRGSKFAVSKVLEAIKKEGGYSNWFILARSNKDLFYLSGLLDQIGLPYTSFRKSETNLAQMEQDLKDDTVKLLTVHTAKGLESKNVLLYGPFPEQVPTYLRNDEERRVMYVGVTRAMDRLVLLN